MSKEKQTFGVESITNLPCWQGAKQCWCEVSCEDCIESTLLAAGYRKQEWISVEERLPEVRQRVLLYSYHDGVNTGYRADEIGRFYVDKSYPYRPTYWMPLPEPPIEKYTEGET